MGFREVVLFGFVLLVSAGNFCAATQNFNSSTNETLSQTPPEKLTASVPLPRSPSPASSNQTDHGESVPSPNSYRLWTYQLKNPAVKPEPLQPQVEKNSPNPPRSEAAKQTSDQLNQGESVQAQELKLLIPGPDLYPPLKPEPEVRSFEQRVPTPAISVAARCGEGEVTVEVKQNFLGNGQLIRPSDLTLGGCAALDTSEQVLHFQTELQSCSSTLTMTEEALIYSFTLLYSPTPIGDTSIVKTNPAEVIIECHYQRRHYVSSNGLRPTWTPFASNAFAEQQLHFSLRLMTEDWQSQRPSSVYFLSDVMHIEAAVLRGRHVPLRVYVDSCVATVSPDPSSQPRYPFITNYGCLNDAKLTGAKSLFMQRSQEDKLQFQLRAFRFQRDHKNSIYITCHMKATTVSVAIDSQHKACSFLTEANRWVASGGDNKVCSCCETSCIEQRRKRGLSADEDLRWQGTATIGPILVEENVVKKDPHQLPPRSAPRLLKQEVPQG
ncbi:zona pellucida sperm-binding protein 3-like [Antennarius striatus]|uniref:zona pellucida sperm-binding protein 3-like n=1 Tax=Antennarius striatus TaxID=241820 RepID=UPI0035ADDC6E